MSGGYSSQKGVISTYEGRSVLSWPLSFAGMQKLGPVLSLRD